MVPTLGATLGVKGHRPTVGTRDCKDLLYVLAVVNVITARPWPGSAQTPEAQHEEQRYLGDNGSAEQQHDFDTARVGP